MTHLLLMMGLCLIRCGVRAHCCAVRDEKAIMDERFCLKIDSHIICVRDWDKKLIAQWGSIEN